MYNLRSTIVKKEHQYHLCIGNKKKNSSSTSCYLWEVARWAGQIYLVVWATLRPGGRMGWATDEEQRSWGRGRLLAKHLMRFEVWSPCRVRSPPRRGPAADGNTPPPPREWKAARCQEESFITDPLCSQELFSGCGNVQAVVWALLPLPPPAEVAIAAE